jgi:hypothetical protein
MEARVDLCDKDADCAIPPPANCGLLHLAKESGLLDVYRAVSSRFLIPGNVVSDA